MITSLSSIRRTRRLSHRTLWEPACIRSLLRLRGWLGWNLPSGRPSFPIAHLQPCPPLSPRTGWLGCGLERWACPPSARGQGLSRGSHNPSLPPDVWPRRNRLPPDGRGRNHLSRQRRGLSLLSRHPREVVPLHLLQPWRSVFRWRTASPPTALPLAP